MQIRRRSRFFPISSLDVSTTGDQQVLTYGNGATALRTAVAIFMTRLLQPVHPITAQAGVVDLRPSTSAC